MPSYRSFLDVRTSRATALGALVSLVFVAAFTYPGHDPKPNGLPVAVLGDAPLPSGFHAVRVADPDEARHAVTERDAYGALLPDRTIVAAGGSAVVAGLLTQLGHGKPVEDVAPLASGDPRGSALNLLILPIVITSIIGALLAVQLAPGLPTRTRIPALGLMGALSGAGTLTFMKALDALPGPFMAQAGLLGLTVTAISLVASALLRIVGPLGLPLSAVVFLVLGNPASGLATAPELLPTPWHPLGGLLPPGAVGDALRGTAYFDGAGITWSIVVLLAWAAAGSVLHLVADRRQVPADSKDHIQLPPQRMPAKVLAPATFSPEELHVNDVHRAER